MPDMEDKADPNEAAESLQRELIIKRIEWQRAAEKHRATRVVTFVFLAIVIIATLLGFMLMMSQLNERREQQPPADPKNSTAP